VSVAGLDSALRLVQFQLERDARDSDALPDALQQGKVLSAVYRVTPPSPSGPQGLALRYWRRGPDPFEAAAAGSTCAGNA